MVRVRLRIGLGLCWGYVSGFEFNWLGSEKDWVGVMLRACLRVGVELVEVRLRDGLGLCRGCLEGFGFDWLLSD